MKIIQINYCLIQLLNIKYKKIILEKNGRKLQNYITSKK